MHASTMEPAELARPKPEPDQGSPSQQEPESKVSPAARADTYRADIDGLRAVAVLAVIGFHAGAPFFRGGYVGVDVFFIISGFLITSIICRQLDQNRFSFWNFYMRRCRRIFAALIVGRALVGPRIWLALSVA